MPIARVQLEDGRIARFEVPEGTTPEQVLEFARQQGIGAQPDGPTQQQPAAPGAVPSAGDIPTPEPTLGQRVLGGLEAARSVATSIAAEPIAGLTGVAAELIPGGRTGGEMVEATRAAAQRFGAPRTEAGQQALETVGEAGQVLGQAALGPVAGIFGLGEAIQTGSLERGGQVVRDIQQQGLGGVLGESAFETTGSPLVAAIAETAPTAVASIVPAARGAQLQRTATNQKILDRLRANPRDTRVSEFVERGGRAVRVPQVREAVRQGFDEGVVSMAKGASTADKRKMLRMTQIARKVATDPKFGVRNRPSDILGQSMSDRVNKIKRLNREAGQNLDRVARDLKGQQADFTPAFDDFQQALDDAGVTMQQAPTGRIRADFSVSDFSDNRAAQRAINSVINRVQNVQVDAFEMHRLKRLIDDQVSYGKAAKGLTGRSERILKDLRRSIDGVLDTNFPDYDNVNTLYSSTVNAIDDFQNAAGQKIDLFGPNSEKSIGTVMRRTLSNAQSRVPLIDAVDEIERVARSNGIKFADDLDSQILFVDQLEQRFPRVGDTSLRGEVGKTRRDSRQGAQVSRGQFAEAATDRLGDRAARLRGVDDDAAFNAMMDLLRR